MKAYKGFDKNLKCLDFQYREGGEYETVKAKLCEAVKAVVDVGYPHNFQREAPHIRGYCYDITRAINKCFAALSASPRNCDKYPTFNDAIRALADKRGWHDAKWDSERYCILASWLYAPYEEGGNNEDN